MNAVSIILSETAFTVQLNTVQNVTYRLAVHMKTAYFPPAQFENGIVLTLEIGENEIFFAAFKTRLND